MRKVVTVLVLAAVVLSGLFAETIPFTWTENKYSRTSEPVEKSVLITVISENDFDEMRTARVVQGLNQLANIVVTLTK